jgi:hypothetical protein
MVRACGKSARFQNRKKVIGGISLACPNLPIVNPIFNRIRPKFVANRR